MKISLIGVFSGKSDEGYKNIATNISQRLSKDHEVMNIDADHIFLHMQEIRKFKPEIIHYLTAPTFSSFVILKLARMYCNRNARLVLSSLHPYSLKILKNPLLKRGISVLKPDVVLTQCNEVKELLEERGCDTAFLPNGVDIERFIPVSREQKEKLREKYKVDMEKFVVLHVGHIRDTRGIRLFENLQRREEGIQVILVGSSYFNMDNQLYRDLIESGCVVWRRYFENIEEVYAMADCYIFPTLVGNSIFMPLSVLEAMSCNLPVLSTRYEGLIDNFQEGDGLIFFDNEEDLYERLEMIRSKGIKIATREKVLPYSWERIVKKLEDTYENLLKNS